MLQDDPNFFPDIDLVPLDLANMDLDLSTIGASQGSTLSPHNSQLAGIGIGSPEDVGGLIIPPSASSFIGGPVGGLDDFDIRGDSGAGSRIERGGFLDDDLGLVIDEEGNMVMTDAPPQQPRAPLVSGEATGFGRASSTGGLEGGSNFQEQQTVSMCSLMQLNNAYPLADAGSERRCIHGTAR